MTGSWLQLAPVGTPDIICSVPIDGVHAIGFIECKVPSGKLTEDQIGFLREINAKHIPWMVCTDAHQIDNWIADPFNYHGDSKQVTLVLDPSQKFVPMYTGKSHRKTDRMTTNIMRQLNEWSGDVKKIKEDIGNPPF